MKKPDFLYPTIGSVPFLSPQDPFPAYRDQIFRTVARDPDQPLLLKL